MERNDQLMIGSSFLAMFLLTISSQFPYPFNYVVVGLAYGSVIIIMFIQEVYVRLKASDYNHIWAEVRSWYEYPRKRIQLWYTDAPKSFFYKYDDDGTPVYASYLKLQIPIKHPRFGRVTMIKILHRKKWGDRIAERSEGTVNYIGFPVSHSHTCDVVLYEVLEDISKKPVEIDYYKPIPIYYMMWSEVDYNEWAGRRKIESKAVEQRRA